MALWTQVITGIVSFLAAVLSVYATDWLRRRTARTATLGLLTARLKHDKFDRPQTATGKPGEVFVTIPANPAHFDWIMQSGLLDPKGDARLIEKILEFRGWADLQREYVRIANFKIFFKPQDEVHMDSLTLSATNGMFKSGHELYVALTQRKG